MIQQVSSVLKIIFPVSKTSATIGREIENIDENIN